MLLPSSTLSKYNPSNFYLILEISAVNITFSYLFWLCCVHIGAWGLSLAVASRGYSPVAVCGLLTVVAYAVEQSSRAYRLSCPVGMWDLPCVGKVKVKSETESHSVVSNSLWPHGLYSPRNSPGQNTGVASLSFLQGIFLTQGSNSGLLHCGWILYQLSHKGSPRILEWVAYPPADLPNPGIKPGSPALQADSLPTELSGKPM